MIFVPSVSPALKAGPSHWTAVSSPSSVPLPDATEAVTFAPSTGTPSVNTRTTGWAAASKTSPLSAVAGGWVTTSTTGPAGLSVAVAVTAYSYGPEQLDAEGQPFLPITGTLPGVRLDVQRECLAAHPGLAAYVVTPAAPVHDCGPNGVRLYADTVEQLQAAAPPSGSPWDVWLDAPAD